MRKVWLVGTWDTKGEELDYLRGLLRARGLRVMAVDVGTRGTSYTLDMPAVQVAGNPANPAAFGNDRGQAVMAMSAALCQRVREALRHGGIDGMLAVGGSGGTSLIAPAMRLLPIGTPKLMVSTMAAGDVRAFVGEVDMTMMFPVTDIAGLNRLSRVVLANAAHALAGMVQGERPATDGDTRAPIGCTMFGVTTPCVQKLRAMLEREFDLQVFHANGAGGRAMEALAASGMLDGIVDVTTTEVLQHLAGGVCDAGPGRLAAAAEHGLAWVGSVGALDMINWGAPSTIPAHLAQRRFHAHNADVTLMRTTAEELQMAARAIADRLNASRAAVRMLLPLRGLSALDAPGHPFHNPDANAALFATLRECMVLSDTHHLIEVDAHINDAAFAQAVAAQIRDCFPRPQAHL